MKEPDYINSLQEAIHHFHGCESSHVKTEQVIELFNDKVVWNGEVEVFRLVNYPGAKQCYAWAYFEDEQQTQKKIVTILEIPPVDSAQAAVRIGIASRQIDPEN